jgi:hypothetical protein
VHEALGASIRDQFEEEAEARGTPARRVEDGKCGKSDKGGKGERACFTCGGTDHFTCNCSKGGPGGGYNGDGLNGHGGGLNGRGGGSTSYVGFGGWGSGYGE